MIDRSSTKHGGQISAEESMTVVYGPAACVAGARLQRQTMPRTSGVARNVN